MTQGLEPASARSDAPAEPLALRLERFAIRGAILAALAWLVLAGAGLALSPVLDRVNLAGRGLGSWFRYVGALAAFVLTAIGYGGYLIVLERRARERGDASAS